MDGQNTKDMKLERLRKSLAIIPQDPLIFEGTVRSNVDPFDEYNDDLIWDALEKVHFRQDNFT